MPNSGQMQQLYYFITHISLGQTNRQAKQRRAYKSNKFQRQSSGRGDQRCSSSEMTRRDHFHRSRVELAATAFECKSELRAI